MSGNSALATALRIREYLEFAAELEQTLPLTAKLGGELIHDAQLTTEHREAIRTALALYEALQAILGILQRAIGVTGDSPLQQQYLQIVIALREELNRRQPV